MLKKLDFKFINLTKSTCKIRFVSYLYNIKLSSNAVIISENNAL